MRSGNRRKKTLTRMNRLEGFCSRKKAKDESQPEKRMKLL